MTNNAESLSSLVERLRRGDEHAAEELWRRYYHRILRLAARRLPQSLRRTRDEEDVALSAFHSFVKGVQDDRFANLAESDNLWGLLIVLTTRKVQAHMRHHSRQKRGGGKVRGESVFIDPRQPGQGSGIGGIAGEVTEPALEAEMAEAASGMLDALQDENLREIAILRMEGYLVDEIAAELDISKRAVERRLQLIRKIWTESDGEHGTDTNSAVGDQRESPDGDR
jgi:RNA polymerase sigma factor (sigma-70 family)